VGFFAPANLLLGLSLAILIAIYLRSRSRPTIEVSSLLLFDESPAPAASVRRLRIDLLFWLEVLGLGALTLAAGGFFLMMPAAPDHGHNHALVFDVGAGMSARERNTDRMSEARASALALVKSAPADERFSVITYALEARVRLAPTANRAAVRAAIADLEAHAVAVRAPALMAAMMRARGSAAIDVFTDRAPPASTLDAARAGARVRVHRFAATDDNLAIVSLDAGGPGLSGGRAVVRNFSARPRLCELAIESGGQALFHRILMLAPREQEAVEFAPPPAGGLVRASIVTPDAIAADNQRWAWAPSSQAARVLVLSPDAAVRDDLARVLLAFNSNYQVQAADPGSWKTAANAMPLALAVMHDCYVANIAAAATLLIYPPAHGVTLPAAIKVIATVRSADMRDPDGGATQPPRALGGIRRMALPAWMSALAIATVRGDGEPFDAIALGRTAAGPLGVITFDIRNHFLLNPDRIDALIATVSLLRRLTAPAGVEIAATGDYLELPASGIARITRPDGTTITLTADREGRVRLRPLQAGRYVIESGGNRTAIYTNYFDAAESDIAGRAPAAERTAAQPNVAAPAPRQPRPLALVLIALALAVLLAESALLVGHARRWGMRHV
jgi:Aerotolerance regulator N-terminal/von Willebrand factor type A domain